MLMLETCECSLATILGTMLFGAISTTGRKMQVSRSSNSRLNRWQWPMMPSPDTAKDVIPLRR